MLRQPFFGGRKVVALMLQGFEPSLFVFKLLIKVKVKGKVKVSPSAAARRRSRHVDVVVGQCNRQQSHGFSRGVFSASGVKSLTRRGKPWPARYRSAANRVTL